MAKQKNQEYVISLLSSLKTRFRRVQDECEQIEMGISLLETEILELITITLTDDEIRLVKGGRKIEAIKSVSVRLTIGIPAAKAVIDSHV